MTKHTYTTTVSDEHSTLRSVPMPEGVDDSIITEAVTRLVDDGKIVESVRVYDYDGKRYHIAHAFEVVDSVLTLRIDLHRVRPSGKWVPVVIKRDDDFSFEEHANDAAVDSVRALIEVEHLVAELARDGSPL